MTIGAARLLLAGVAMTVLGSGCGTAQKSAATTQATAATTQANLDGSGANQSFIAGANGPVGVTGARRPGH